MSLKMSNRKMRRGFMCHCEASTAVCMSTRDPRSIVVLPKRVDKNVSIGDTRLINYTKYSKLVEPPRPKPVPKINLREKKNQDYQAIAPMDLHKTSTDNVFQVVVMRVAIHCQGCAGKVKKHLSKMEGVTSFSIDLDSKRVTVMGHVSPIEVLESISKVKRAEFWTAC